MRAPHVRYAVEADFRVGAFGLDALTRDSALLVTLNPGACTVQVSGVGDTVGDCLVEVYEVPPQPLNRIPL